jgi:CHAT domain-containing protein
MNFLSFQFLWLLIVLPFGFSASLAFEPSDENKSPAPAAIYSSDDAPELSVNAPLTRPMDKNETHFYRFRGEAGKSLHLAVEQRGTNVIVTLISPSQKQLAFVERSNTLQGPENLTFVLPEDGSYTVKVTSNSWVEIKNGYTIELKPFTAPTADDFKRIEAERLVSEADGLSFNSDSKRRKESIEMFKRGVDLWNELGEEYEKNVAYYGLGWAYFNEGDYENAAATYGKAAENFRRSDERFMLAHCLRANAFANSNLGEYVSAVLQARESVSIFRSFEMSRYIGAGLQALGYAQYFLDDYQNALATLTEALEHRQRSKDRNGEILTLTGLAKTHSKLENYPRALEFIEKAKQKAENSNLLTRTEILTEEGWILMSLKRFDDAEKDFVAALKNYKAEDNVSGQAIAYCGLGLVKQNKNRLKDALPDIEKSLGLIEDLRGKLSDNALRLSFSATNQFYYEIHINLLMALHRAYPTEGYDAKAFEVSEKARARVLLDLMNESTFFRQSNAAPELKNKMRAVQSRYVANLKDWKRLTRAKDEAALKSLNLEIQKTLLEKREIEAELKNKFTGKSKFQAFRPFSAGDIQNLLDDETVLLEFGLYHNNYGGTNSYLWAVTKDKIHGFELPERTAIEEKVNLAFQLLTIRNNLPAGLAPREKAQKINEAEKRFRTVSAELSRMLFASAAQKNLFADAKRLLIVSNGILQSLPFTALPDPTNEAEYLISKFEIVSLPSASILGALRERRKNRSDRQMNVLVLADPVFSENDERFSAVRPGRKKLSQTAGTVLRVADYFTQNELPRLFNTRFEAQSIASYLPPSQKRVALDFDARAEFVTKADLSNYRLLHFATHALIDDETPELSGVVFSMVDKKRQPIEGFLLSGDIFELKLDADLVVLSGCRTGLGKPVRGEGFVGLTQSFMYAGTSRLLTSLWSIEDRATAQLMANFYKYHLEKKMPAAAALKEAQKEMIKGARWQSPYFWAAFTFQGEPQ